MQRPQQQQQPALQFELGSQMEDSLLEGMRQFEAGVDRAFGAFTQGMHMIDAAQASSEQVGWSGFMRCWCGVARGGAWHPAHVCGNVAHSRAVACCGKATLTAAFAAATAGVAAAAGVGTGCYGCSGSGVDQGGVGGGGHKLPGRTQVGRGV